jgi:hypothetical protein
VLFAIILPKLFLFGLLPVQPTGRHRISSSSRATLF